MKKYTIILVILFSLIGIREAKAQGIAIKTNVAGWAVFVPNIGVDLCVSESSSLEAIFYKSATDSWLMDGNFTALQLGYRYWFDSEPLNSFFCGITATPARYEIKVNGNKHKGDCIPYGVNIGYCWPLSDKLNFEISYGIGGLYFFEDLYGYNKDGEYVVKWSRDKNRFAPTNIGINISYIIK